MVEPGHHLETQEILVNPTIKTLLFYPLKSGRGQRVDVAQLTRRGILHDRELMAVDAQTGVFITQRTDPRLALITTTFGDDEFKMEAQGVAITTPVLKEGTIVKASVHSSKGLKTIDQGDAAARFVSGVIGRNARVVRLADGYVRKIKPENVSHDVGVSDEVGLADGAALLLTTEESAVKVREWIEFDTPSYPFVPIDNYRGNIEVEGFGFPFAEDFVVSAHSGNVMLDFRWKCSRCEETTTDQLTGERNPEIGPYIDDHTKRVRQPLYSLTQHRMGEYAPGKRGALFGINVQPKFLDNTPVLRVNDRIEVLHVSAV